MLALEIVFWLSVALVVYTHVGYPLLLVALSRRFARSSQVRVAPAGDLPTVTLIVAAHNEESVIERWVKSALGLDYPAARLRIIVVCDGCTDATAERAGAAGADRVIELERGGKVAALNAAAAEADSDVLAFSDANAVFEPRSLRELVVHFSEPEVGYVCGQVRFEATEGTANEEGLYWSYEMAVRKMESELGGITAGNGAINAVRRAAYLPLEPTRGQDISMPFELAKRGWRSVYEPAAMVNEPMAPTIDAEFRRKRRMMAGAWNTIFRTSLLSPRGYRPLYALEIYSHRLLRYVSPLLHLLILALNVVLLGEGWVYAVTLGAQVALLVTALLGRVVPWRPLQIARYYVSVTISIAVGLWDFLRRGVPGTWESVEGTR
jgi:cellulose synthase/poly-beta-1,6-N-acetylglucosamine synthase-like glycosyltransferase